MQHSPKAKRSQAVPHPKHDDKHSKDPPPSLGADAVTARATDKLTDEVIKGHHQGDKLVNTKFAEDGMEEEESAPAKILSFGTTQEKKIFPIFSSPDFMGNKQPPIRGKPEVGPGTYNNAIITSFIHELQKRPESKKGYVIGARTANRFPHTIQTTTVSPVDYQGDLLRERTFTPAFAPFNIKSRRFSISDQRKYCNPGPGAYEHDVSRTRKVSWPMRFGSPDWMQIPTLEQRTLKPEFISDTQFRKHRNRIAYLSLYYS
ncbi:protein pitchfork-like [Polypterus senegalus]|uniref:protein pitchfork-like n=1 Tax=Polypterus senegalus TaxID=55291 RepID=UPI0019664D14|nr:protein pitchfork-like [Polypterus senegalus]